MEVSRFFDAVSLRFSYWEYDNGSPSGAVTPRWVGDMCHDTTNDDWYISYGKTDTDWKSITD